MLTIKLPTTDNQHPADTQTSPNPRWASVYDSLTRPRHLPLSDQESLLLYDARREDIPFEGGHITAWHWGRAVRSASKQLGELHALISHSMGSAASLHAFAHGLQVKASVHLAGPSSLTRVLRYAGHANGLDATELNALLAAFTQRIRQPLSAMDLSTLTPGLRHSALIFHDPEDAEMPAIESSKLAAAWPTARLIEPTGVGHRRILRDPQVIDQSIAALQEAALLS